MIVPVAMWANSNVDRCGDGVDQRRRHGRGPDPHERRPPRSAAVTKTFHGPVEYVRTLDVGGVARDVRHRRRSRPRSSRSRSASTIADYRPGGRAAVEAGAAYHDMSSARAGPTASGRSTATRSRRASTTRPAPSSSTAIRSAGRSRSPPRATSPCRGPARSSIRTWTACCSCRTAPRTSAIRIDAANSTFFGYSFAERGRIVLTGVGDKFYCGILADRIDISSQSLLVHGSACSRPGRTVAPPTIVPALSLDLSRRQGRRAARDVADPHGRDHEQRLDDRRARHHRAREPRDARR